MIRDFGGPGRTARQHESGRPTAHEAIDSLADAETFQEIGELAGTATYDGDQLTELCPSTSVTGIAKIDGRRVAVAADDATVPEDQPDTNAAFKHGNMQKIALEWKMPLVRILDGVRGSTLEAERSGRAYLMDEDAADEAMRLLDTAPVATAIIGPVTGLHASDAALSHFSVAVKGAGSVAHTQEDPGGDSGISIVDNVADTPEEAFAQVRRFLSYLPQNVWEMAPRVETGDDPNRRDERLLGLVPERRSRMYNPRPILDGVFDMGSVFEIGSSYGEACITALARVNGYPVGILLKNPMSPSLAAMDTDTSDKLCRFLQVCESFHLPVVYFVDEPGFMIGVEAQKTGLIRTGSRLVLASVQTRMPYITFMVRQVYGVAGTLFTRGNGMYKHYAWASANWGGMHIEGGTMAAYRRDIESAPDPAARQAEIERYLWMLSHPFRSMEAFEVDDMIDPRDTRRLICEFVDAAQAVLRTQLGPPKGIAYLP